MILNNKTYDDLIKFSEDTNVYLSGEIIKHLNAEKPEHVKYLNICKKKHKKNAADRYEISQKILLQRDILKKKEVENKKLLSELTIRNLELEKEKKKNEDILLLVQKDKENIETKLKLVESERRHDMINSVSKWIIFIIVGIIIGIFVIYLSHLYMGKDMEVIGSQIFGLFDYVITAGVTMIGSFFGMKHALKEKEG